MGPYFLLHVRAAPAGVAASFHRPDRHRDDRLLGLPIGIPCCGLSPLVLATGRLVAATVLLSPLLAGVEAQPIRWALAPVMALLVLGVLGTGLAYVINFALITSEGATGASVVTYLVPVTAAILGVAILGEPWTWLSVVGLVAILTGVSMAR